MNVSKPWNSEFWALSTAASAASWDNESELGKIDDRGSDKRKVNVMKGRR